MDLVDKLRAMAQEMREAVCVAFGHAHTWNVDEQNSDGLCPRCGRPLEQQSRSTS
jgi:hypothetical protein